MRKVSFPPTKNLTRIRTKGDILSDRRESGKEKPWRMNKQLSKLLARVAKYLGEDKRFGRIDNCAYFLRFLECPLDITHPKRLIAASFCKDRLCPACQWRKSLKEFCVALEIAHVALSRHKTLRFLFLTLTVPNVPLERLRDEITHICKSWDRLRKRKEVKRVLYGFHRAIEITYNHESNTYHPHVHVVLAVPSRYFAELYIKQARWQELWEQSTRYPAPLIVDIRSIKHEDKTDEKLLKAFAEACKYSLKEWDIPQKKTRSKKPQKNLIPDVIDFGSTNRHMWIRDTLEESAEIVEKLRAALYHKRLVQFGGMFREIKKELKLKDSEESDDLVHLTDEDKGCNCEVCSAPLGVKVYVWKQLMRNYVS